MDEKKLRIGVIGIGRWGKNLLKEFNLQADVVYCCHKGSPESTQFLKENYPHIESTTSYEKILADETIDAVVIATPTPTHFQIASDSMDAGKHIFLEKPAGNTSEELRLLCEKAEKNNLTFAVGYEFAHHPALTKIKELLPIEKMKGIYFQWLKWGTFEMHSVPHHLSHDISVLLALGIKNIKPIQYKQHTVISESDIVSVEFENTNSIDISSYINRVNLNKDKTVIVRTENGGYVWNNNELFEIDVNASKYTKVEIPIDTPLNLEIRDFLHCIQNNQKPLIDGDFALDVFNIIDKIKYK